MSSAKARRACEGSLLPKTDHTTVAQRHALPHPKQARTAFCSIRFSVWLETGPSANTRKSAGATLRETTIAEKTDSKNFWFRHWHFSWQDVDVHQ
jgi:hypothetical protein